MATVRLPEHDSGPAEVRVVVQQADPVVALGEPVDDRREESVEASSEMISSKSPDVWPRIDSTEGVR